MVLPCSLRFDCSFDLSMSVTLPGICMIMALPGASLGLSMTSWVLYDYGNSWGIFIIIVENILLITVTFDIFDV